MKRLPTLVILLIAGLAQAGEPERLTDYMDRLDRFHSAGAGHYLWSPEPFAMVTVVPGRWQGKASFDDLYPVKTTCIRHDLLGDWFFKEAHTFGLLPAANDAEAMVPETPTVKPSYLRIRLDEVDTEAEITGTQRAGIYRLTFPAGETNHLRLLNFTHLELRSQTEAWARATVGQRPRQDFYLTIRSSAPMTAAQLDPKVKTRDPAAAGKVPMIGKGRIDLDLPDGGTVVLKVGFSWVSFRQAAANLEAEIGQRDFQAVRAASLATWEDLAGRIRLEAPESIKRAFYNNLYASCVYNPRVCSDADGTYRKVFGHKGEPIGKLAGGKVHYTNWWDGMGDLKSKYPLYALVMPNVLADIMDSHVRNYRDSESRLTSKVKGLLPHDTMWATYPDLLLCEAYLRGVRDFDAEGALEGMLVNGRELRSRNLQRDGADIQRYHRLGYFPVDMPEGGNLQTRAGSQTLNAANCDWAIAMMARAMGRDDVFDQFAPRALNYRRLWYDKLEVVRPRMTDGSWYAGDKEPWSMHDFHGGGFAEESPYSATVSYIFQDQKWIVEQMGPDVYERRLDEWFSATGEFENAPRAGRFGGAKGSSIPYCYHYVGKCWKAQRQLRRLLLTPELSQAISYCDSGTASALTVLNILGLNTYAYGHPSYYIGTPLIDRAELKVGGGTFTIAAEGNDLEPETAIQSAWLNGKDYDKSYLMHEDVAAGGQLRFRMGKGPSDWASAAESRPYSVSDDRWEPDWPETPAGTGAPRP
jgi:predicted alpha-1,2-mannosidase